MRTIHFPVPLALRAVAPLPGGAPQTGAAADQPQAPLTLEVEVNRIGCRTAGARGGCRMRRARASACGTVDRELELAVR